VTLIVDATVVVRKFRRLKPKALFAEDALAPSFCAFRMARGCVTVAGVARAL
jgi:hypothetical protein